MTKRNREKKLRQIIEIDLSNLPVEETTKFLKLLVEFSKNPSKPLAVESLRALYSIGAKLGLLPATKRRMAKKRPPDEPRRRKPKKKSFVKKEEGV